MLRQVALELLAEIGYEGFTIDAVAARARAGKATVYRRWSSKVELVIDAVTHRLVPVTCPDTGSLHGDLHALACGVDAAQDRAFTTRLLAGVVSSLVHHTELRDAFRQTTLPAGDVLRTIVDRAVDRGEISPPPDVDLITSVLPAMTLYHLVMFGEHPGGEFAHDVVDKVVLPLVSRAPGPRRPRRR